MNDVGNEPDTTLEKTSSIPRTCLAEVVLEVVWEAWEAVCRSTLKCVSSSSYNIAQPTHQLAVFNLFGSGGMGGGRGGGGFSFANGGGGGGNPFAGMGGMPGGGGRSRHQHQHQGGFPF